MENNIFAQITLQYPNLTKTEKKIADYVLRNKNEVQYLSIASLAENCNVGEASIFRFCKTLHLDSYNEFKLTVARSLIQDEIHSTPADTAFFSYGKVVPTDTFQELCHKLYSSQVNALNQTLSLANEAAYKKAAQYLLKAKQVFCFGQGNSLVLAMIAWSRFMSVSKKFCYVEDSHLQATNIALSSSEDAIIFFSYSGATKEIVNVLPVAKQNGAKIILVTRFENSPAAKLADVVLICGSNEGPLQIGSMAAKAAILMVIDILFNEYWILDTETCKENAEKTSQMISKRLL